MKKIHVLHNYGGAVTGELRIAPGVYDVDAPELFGAAEYLVANGHAVGLGSDDVKPVREATKAVEVPAVESEPGEPKESEAKHAPAKPSKK